MRRFFPGPEKEKPGSPRKRAGLGILTALPSLSCEVLVSGRVKSILADRPDNVGKDHSGATAPDLHRVPSYPRLFGLSFRLSHSLRETQDKFRHQGFREFSSWYSGS